MHVVFITPKFIPNLETGGAAIYNQVAIEYLIENGHQVTLIHFDALQYNVIYPEAATVLENMGVRLVSFTQPVSHRVKEGFISQPTESDIFPHILLRDQVSSFLRESKPDLIFAYGDGAMAPVKDVSDIPVIVQLGDPMHLIQLIRWQYDYLYNYPFGFNMDTLKWGMRIFNSLRRDMPSMLFYPHHLKMILKNISCSVTVCPQHIERYEKLTGTNCYFTPIPLEDSIGPDWATKRKQIRAEKRSKVKLLWVGKPANTENRYAVRFLVRELFPELVKLIPLDSFELHVVGDDRNCPPELTQLAQKYPNLYIRGHVHDIDSEWLSADVYVVTNTTTVGARTRILSSFSGGNCVVAHIANTAGIPALKDGENILIGKNGREMAQQIYKAIQDNALREKLGKNGRQVYKTYYEKSVAAQFLMSIFQKTVEEFHLANGARA
jgi:glycosyltransferase involved in cell wall biosynthesis